MLYQDLEADKEAKDTGIRKKGISSTNKGMRHPFWINGSSEMKRNILWTR